MMRDWIILAMLVLSLFMETTAGLTVNQQTYTVYPITGMRLEPLTTRLTHQSLISCGAVCESTVGCVSFSFHLTGLCEINSYNPNDVLATNYTEQGWIMFTKFDDTCWPVVGYEGFVRNGTCYFWATGTPTVAWELGQKDCRDKGAELACIESDAENEALVDHVPVWLWWFGLNDSDEDGVFTCNNVSVTFEKWAPQEPGSELCVAVLESDLMWYDGTCSADIAYVCEKQIY